MGNMNTNKYFNEALSNMVAEYAYVSDIRHLHDKGLSIAEIQQQLCYPVTTDRIEKVIADYENPEKHTDSNMHFELTYDEYGRRSYRKVK